MIVRAAYDGRPESNSSFRAKKLQFTTQTGSFRPAAIYNVVSPTYDTVRRISDKYLVLRIIIFFMVISRYD